MTIPLSRKAVSIEKTLLSSKQAILDRLKKRGWVVREGRPNMKALPNDGAQAVSVWVFPVRTRTDLEGQSSIWHSEVFATEWVITATTPDTGADKDSSSSDRIVHVAGAILEALTTTNDDTSLDGNINWTDSYKAEYGIASVGGDRSSLVAIITLQAHHPIFPNRVPPIAAP